MLGGVLPAVAILVAAQEVQAPPEFAVLVVEFRAVAEFAGVPAVCPGSAPNEAVSEEDICVVELYDVSVRTVRRISGPAKVAGRMLRYTAHNLNGPVGRRLLVQAFPWKREWLVAGWWDTPDERGEVCLDAQDAENLQIEAQWSRWREPVIAEHGRVMPYPVRCLRL